MSKKKKHGMNNSPDYYDEKRIQELLERANLDITNLDENGDPYEESPVEYEYTKPSVPATREDVEMPSYDQFTSAKKKKKKKEKRISIEGDYNLTGGKMDKDLDNFIAKMVKNEQKAEESQKKKVPDFDPDVFDYSHVSDEEEESDPPTVIKPGNTGTESVLADESDYMVAEKYEPEIVEEEKTKAYTVASDICSLKFNLIEPLERLTIDDGVAPNSYWAGNLCFDAEDLNMGANLVGLCITEDEEGGYRFSERLYSDAIHQMYLYILTMKHPCAIMTEEQYYHDFADVASMDGKAFYLFYDGNRKEPLVYGYHVSPKNRRALDNFITMCKEAILNNDAFLDDIDEEAYHIGETERNKLAILAAWIYLARNIPETSMFMDRNEKYVQLLRSTYIVAKPKTDPDEEEERIPAFNMAPLFVDLIHRNRKTEICQDLSDYEEDIDQRTGIWDFIECKENAEGLLDFFEAEEEDEEEESGDKPNPQPPVVEDVDEEDEEDVFGELEKQVHEYAESNVDYAGLVQASRTTEAVAMEVYKQYCSDFCGEHPGMNPPSFEEFLEDPKFADILSISFTNNVIAEEEEDEEEYEEPIQAASTPEPAPELTVETSLTQGTYVADMTHFKFKETKAPEPEKETAGFSQMQDALTKAGINQKSDDGFKDLVVPVMRRK